MNPIGFMKSTFRYKNGTPRQACVCPEARAQLTIETSVFNNPEHSLEGIEQFSYLWIIFCFHKNNNECRKAKVKPPRLNGAKMGLFATRSPYRPNPIGLSLVKLDRVQDATLYLSGVDILDGTPVLDVKPYIPDYDQPILNGIQDGTVMPSEIKEDEVDTGFSNEGVIENDSSSFDGVGVDLKSQQISGSDAYYASTAERHEIFTATSTDDLTKVPVEYNLEKVSEDESLLQEIATVYEKDPVKYNFDQVKISEEKILCREIATVCEPGTSRIKTAAWVQSPPISRLSVRFTQSSERQLLQFSAKSSDPLFQLTYFEKCTDLKRAIYNILSADPRSSYRRRHCLDRLYYFIVDTVHVICWFDENCAEVLKVEPKIFVKKLPSH